MSQTVLKNLVRMIEESDMSREQKEDAIKTAGENKQRSEENLGRKYIPNVKCEDFIRVIGENKAFINLLSAANGVGKTAVGANIIANICFGPQPFDGTGWEQYQDEFGDAPRSWFDYPLFIDFPYLKRGRIISDPTTIETTIVPELKKWFPPNRVRIIQGDDPKYITSKGGKKFESRWITDTGFEFDLMSTEQATKEFESTSLGWCWIDEPLPRSIFGATIARARRGMICMMTMTPLFHAGWVKDEIVDKQDGEFVDYVKARVWDNCKEEKGTRGILLRKDIDRMISQYNEDEIKARVEGEFGHLLGRVHKKFDRKIHVVKPFKIDYREWVVGMAVDTHPRTPEHVIWMAMNKKKTKFFCDELIFSGTTEQLAKEILRIEKKRYRVILRLLDPSGFEASQDKRKHANDQSVAEIFNDSGLEFEPGSKNLQGGIRRTDDALWYEERKGIFIAQPECFWFDNVDVAIKQLDEYVWQEHQGKTADQKKLHKSPRDKDDHQPENIHRLLMAEMEWMDPPLNSKVQSHFNKKIKRKKKKQSVFKRVNY